MNRYINELNEGLYNRLLENCVLFVSNETKINAQEFSYFLIQKRIKGVIVDDFKDQVNDKKSLLEALRYQIGLFDMYSLNWDSFDEAFSLFLKNIDYGVAIIFKNEYPELLDLVEDELKILTECVLRNNKSNSQKSFLLVFD